MQIGVEAQRAVENRRVFVVDDDEINRAVLQFMLADENETHEFATVSGALTKGLQWKPDLLLIGLQTVTIEGPELLARLRSTLGEVKIILTCDNTDDATLAIAKSVEASDTMPRPFKLETVRRKVDRQLGRKLEMRIPVVVA